MLYEMFISEKELGALSMQSFNALPVWLKLLIGVGLGIVGTFTYRKLRAKIDHKKAGIKSAGSRKGRKAAKAKAAKKAA